MARSRAIRESRKGILAHISIEENAEIAKYAARRGQTRTGYVTQLVRDQLQTEREAQRLLQREEA